MIRSALWRAVERDDADTDEKKSRSGRKIRAKWPDATRLDTHLEIVGGGSVEYVTEIVTI